MDATHCLITWQLRFSSNHLALSILYFYTPSFAIFSVASSA